MPKVPRTRDADALVRACRHTSHGWCDDCARKYYDEGPFGIHPRPPRAAPSPQGTDPWANERWTGTAVRWAKSPEDQHKR